MNDDAPCTGEPPRAVVAYIGSADGLRVAPVLVIDFYDEPSPSLPLSIQSL